MVYKSSWTNFVKFGFGIGFGVHLSSIIFLLIGGALFILGIFLLSNERKKKEKNNSLFITAYVLMFLGMVLGLGMGASFLFSNLLQDLS